MLISLAKISLYILSILAITNSYDLTSSDCSSNTKQQSPINIISKNTRYFEEKTIKIINVNYTSFDTQWKVFPEERAVGFEGNFGNVIFVKDWALYNFTLNKVYFRMKSSHSINNKYFEMEMELVHHLDEEYRSKGRYIYPTAKQLVISIFFEKLSDSSSEATTKTSLLFDYANLEEYAKGTSDVKFKRELKLKYLVHNSPSYFYEGSITHTVCETAWRLVLPKYQLLKQIDLDNMKAVLTRNNFIDEIGSNSRFQQPTPNIIYVNDNDPLTLRFEASKLQFDSHKIIKMQIGFLALILLFLL